LRGDLAAEPDFDVAVADIRESAFDRLANTSKIRKIRADLSCPDRVKELVASAEFVAGAIAERLRASDNQGRAGMR